MRSTPPFAWAAATTLALGVSCAVANGPSAHTRVVAPPRDLDELTVQERRTLLDRAEIWHPTDTARLDLMRGPQDGGAFTLDQSVTCTFHLPKEPLSGVTPKFECDVAPEDTVKVKYGRDNGEVFAEVAASRLFWALGFFVDRMYPVKVVCLECPADPYRASAYDFRLAHQTKGTILFDPAAIERKLPGEQIEVPGFKGWSWRELETLDLSNAGASLAHRDALKLLAVFIQHVDSKPEQQALVCAEGSTGRDSEGNATCDRPVLMVKDLGSSFGGAKRMSFDKMKLESWRSVPIWKDQSGCRGDLTRSIIGTLENPMISDEGRRFLLEQLDRLSDKQLRDLFAAARVERRDDYTHGRRVTADDWVAAFKEKREQIRNRRCA
jgi:hypothetical protein